MSRKEYWDRWFLGLAEYVSTASKDPSTKCGAVIVDKKRRIVSVGYNGFARGVDDNPKHYLDRNVKLRKVLHAENNAILFADKPLDNCTIYTWPLSCCAHCAAMIIQKGIVRVVSPMTPVAIAMRWGDDLILADGDLRHAGVKLTRYENAKVRSPYNLQQVGY